jgi:plasmid maintenance system antidote protein VapI
MKNMKLVEPIDFRKLRNNLKELMDEVDARLESEFDAFSPEMWSKLQRTVDATILRIRAVRLALNGATTADIAVRLHLKKQYVAALLAYNTMWQRDYASPEEITGSVDCPVCHAGIGNRCVTTSGADARVHESRRQTFRRALQARALNMKQIRRIQNSPTMKGTVA